MSSAQMAILKMLFLGRPLMYNWEGVGVKVEPWGVSALIGHSRKDFHSETLRSRLLLNFDMI